MDELEISGKRYISTRRAAKDNKYHSDYIGQLIRAGKVEGQKVGRSWYVAADSLAGYLGKEGVAKILPAPKVPEPVERQIVEEVVAPVEEKKVTVAVKEVQKEIKPEEVVEFEKEKETHHIPVKITKQVEFKKETPVVRAPAGLRYVADDGPLYPHTERQSMVHVMPRSAKHEESVIDEPEVFEEEDTHPIQLLERPHIPAKKGGKVLFNGRVILILGALTLAVAAAGSAFVVSNTTIQGSTASVSYSLQGINR